MRTIGGPAAWRGADIRDSAEWQVVLDGPQRAELLSALDVLKTAAASRPDNPLRVVTVEDFPLPRLEPVFAAALEPTCRACDRRSPAASARSSARCRCMTNSSGVDVDATRRRADRLGVAQDRPAARYTRRGVERGGAPALGGGVSTRVQDAVLTTRQVRAQATRVLPGVHVRRLPFWRYELRWRRPR